MDCSNSELSKHYNLALFLKYDLQYIFEAPRLIFVFFLTNKCHPLTHLFLVVAWTQIWPSCNHKIKGDHMYVCEKSGH